MLKPNSRSLDDAARLVGGAANVISAVRDQVKNDIRERVQDTLQSMDLVRREDFEDAKTQLQVLTEEMTLLKQRLDDLENKKPD